MDDKEVKKRKIIRCKRCGSTQIYYRIKENNYFCRKCGHENEGKLEDA